MNSTIETRPAALEDLAEVLRLNQAAPPHVSGLTPEALRGLFDEAAMFHVATIDGACAGVLLALPPGARYDCENYRWFSQRYSHFLYIDRVCVSPKYWRRGVASRLYVDVEQFALDSHTPLLTCEVNLEPPNPASLAFHDRHGFEEVGTQWTEGGTKLVSLRVKRLRADKTGGTST